MKYFDQHHVEEIRQRADIVSYIQRFVPLHKKGSRYLGICPFHNDKSPSMNVNPTMGVYKCFACNAGGDVFKFTMDHDRMDFPSAVISVAEWLGYPLPEREVHQIERSQKQGLHEIMLFAEKHFAKELAKHPEIIKYIHQRGLGAETIAHFNLGYAPTEWDSLLKNATQAGIAKKELVDAGLIIENENGRTYDRYRHRFIIPIQNLSGKVVAFGGRALDPEEKAKYINSPETNLYKKSEILFGLSHAKQAIAKAGEFYMVEGYMDFLQMWQHGIHNVCAVSGTALTHQHSILIKRFAQKAILLFDGDGAGRKAAERSIPILLEAGIEVHIMDFPEGEDPDSLLKNKGKETFLALRETCTPWVEWICREIHDLSTPEDKARTAKKLRDFLEKIPEPIVRQGYARKAAQILGLAEKWMQSSSQSAPQFVQQITQTPRIQFKKGPERRMLEWVLRHPFLLEFVQVQLPLELFKHEDYAEIMDFALSLHSQQQFEIKKLWDRVNPNQRSILESFELSHDSAVDKDHAFKEYLQMLTRMMLDFVEFKLSLLSKSSLLYEEITRWDEDTKKSQMQNMRELQKQIFPPMRVDQEKFQIFMASFQSIKDALETI